MGARGLRALWWWRGGANSDLLVSCRPTVGGSVCLDLMVLLEIRVVRRRRPGLLEASDGQFGDPVLLALSRDTRRVYGGLPLVAHRRPAVPDPGLHGV